jgi:hypothetical protein
MYVWGGSPAVIAACERHAAQLRISMEGGYESGRLSAPL